VRLSVLSFLYQGFEEYSTLSTDIFKKSYIKTFAHVAHCTLAQKT